MYEPERFVADCDDDILRKDNELRVDVFAEVELPDVLGAGDANAETGKSEQPAKGEAYDTQDPS